MFFQEHHDEFRIGDKVVRGPDWYIDDQDGGKGSIGKVIGFERDGWIVVRWPNGVENAYRHGQEGCFDIERFTIVCYLFYVFVVLKIFLVFISFRTIDFVKDQKKMFVYQICFLFLFLIFLGFGLRKIDVLQDHQEMFVHHIFVFGYVFILLF